jgi:hypothetical protein
MMINNVDGCKCGAVPVARRKNADGVTVVAAPVTSGLVTAQSAKPIRGDSTSAKAPRPTISAPTAKRDVLRRSLGVHRSDLKRSCETTRPVDFSNTNQYSSGKNVSGRRPPNLECGAFKHSATSPQADKSTR